MQRILKISEEKKKSEQENGRHVKKNDSGESGPGSFKFIGSHKHGSNYVMGITSQLNPERPGLMESSQNAHLKDFTLFPGGGSIIMMVANTC